MTGEEEEALSHLPVLEEGVPRLVPVAPPLPLDHPYAAPVTALRLQLMETSVDLRNKLAMSCKKRVDHAEYVRDTARERLKKAHKGVMEAEQVLVDAQIEFNNALSAHTDALAYAIDASDSLSGERARSVVDFEAVARGV
jgi:hypothetical protein